MEHKERPPSAWTQDNEHLRKQHLARRCSQCLGAGYLWHIPEEFYPPGDFGRVHGQPHEVSCHFCDGTGYAKDPEQVSGCNTATSNLHWAREPLG